MFDPARYWLVMPPQKAHGVYFPGEIIKGELRIQSLDPIVFPRILPQEYPTRSSVYTPLPGVKVSPYPGLKLQLRGQGKVVLRRFSGPWRFLKTRELYIKKVLQVVDLRRVLPEAEGLVLPQDMSVYKIEILLPLGLPPSFASPRGKWGRIKYRLELIRVETFHTETLIRRSISVAPFAPLDRNALAVLPAKDEMLNTHHYLCWGTDRNITGRILLTKAGVLTGQRIPFLAQVINNSDDAVKSCHVTLSRRWVWHSIGETTKKSERVKSFRKVSRGPIPPGGTMTWSENDQPLVLPYDLIPTGPPGCTIMNVSYELRFTIVPQGMARNMTLRLPIIVGSDLPQDMRADVERNTAIVGELARLSVVFELLRNTRTGSAAAQRADSSA